MKVIIAGSRNIPLPTVAVYDAVEASGWKSRITEVVSGCARGIDRAGETFAVVLRLPVMRFRPDWVMFGKRAGIIRNQQMADYADALIAVWDGQSRGTKDMIDRANKKGMKVYVHHVESTNSPRE